VIASRFGGFMEVVAEGRTGLFYAPQDPTGLATCITTLQNNPALRDQMSTNAPGWAAQFAWPAVTDRVEAVYRRLRGN